LEYENDVIDFSTQADEGLRKLVENMEHLQKNLNHVNQKNDQLSQRVANNIEWNDTKKGNKTRKHE
jgi:uncharacterized protein YoxC